MPTTSNLGTVIIGNGSGNARWLAVLRLDLSYRPRSLRQPPLDCGAFVAPPPVHLNRGRSSPSPPPIPQGSPVEAEQAG
jgi:hypothetical protein